MITAIMLLLLASPTLEYSQFFTALQAAKLKPLDFSATLDSGVVSEW